MRGTTGRTWAGFCFVVVVIAGTPALRAEFSGGVEHFDGTSKDLTTWEEYPGGGSAITQNGALTVVNAEYTTRTLALGVGQGIRAKVTLPLSQPFRDAYLFLTTNSAGTSGPWYQDSRYVGVHAVYEDDFDRTIFRGVDGVPNTSYHSFICQLAGDHTAESFTLQAERLSTNVFTFSVFDFSGALLGSQTRDVTVSPGNNVQVPPSLFISLASYGTWDDVTIISVVPEPIGLMPVALLAMTAALRRRRRARG